MNMKDQMNRVLDLFTELIDDRGQDIADSYFQFYEQLQEAGFDEDEALEILKDNPMEMNAGE